jgi:hypothetical protein
MAEHQPYPENVPGDFYVEDGCCTMCEAPFAEAPELFGVCQDPKGYPHCYVKRQPATPAEQEQMIGAIRVAELRCIRYRGRDPEVQRRLVEGAEGPICDDLPPDLQKRSEQVLAAQRASRSLWGRLSRWLRGGRA